MPATPITAGTTVRDVNRHLILGLIRAKQPISRAEVARQTGLQPSTVSLITEELIRQRWVTEGATGEGAAGGSRDCCISTSSAPASSASISVRG